ncbi:hypothetical protein GCM10023159_01080 [Brevibacterium yomogidense]
MRAAVAAVTFASGAIDPGSSVYMRSAAKRPATKPVQRIVTVRFGSPGSLNPAETIRPSDRSGGYAGRPELAAVRVVGSFRCWFVSLMADLHALRMCRDSRGVPDVRATPYAFCGVVAGSLRSR